MGSRGGGRRETERKKSGEIYRQIISSPTNGSASQASHDSAPAPGLRCVLLVDYSR